MNDYLDIMWSLKKKAVIDIVNVTGETLQGQVTSIRETEKDNDYFTVCVRRVLGNGSLDSHSVTYMIKTGK